MEAAKISLFVTGALLVLLVGVEIGTSIGGKYVDGRLSACKDMMNILRGANPLVAMANPECVLYKGDAAIKIGEKLFSLDGTKDLN